MKSPTSIKSIGKPISAFLHRYHLVIYVLIVAGSLAAAIFSLHQIVNVPIAPDAVTKKTTFDTDTMERIEKLQTRDNADSELNLPEGRINPLGE